MCDPHPTGVRGAASAPAASAETGGDTDPGGAHARGVEARGAATGRPGGLAGAVLVGGASSRMGRDKATLAWGATTLAGHAIGVLRAAGCDPVVVVGSDIDRHGGLGVEIVEDLHPGAGPLGGIVTALAALAPGPGGPDVAIVACDMPGLLAEVIGDLAARRRRSGADVVVARTSAVPGAPARTEGLLAVWSPGARTPLERAFAGGERAVHRALAAMRVQHVAVPIAVARNVNAPWDLEPGAG